MKNHRTLRRAAAAFAYAGVALTALATGSGAANADSTLTSYLQTWDPRTPDVQDLQELSNSSSDLDGQVDQGWADNIGLICNMMKAKIEAPRQYKHDEYRGYDTVCQLAPSGTLTIGKSYVEQGKPVLQFSYTTLGNYMEFTVTQPYFDKWADPRLSFKFDMTVNFKVYVNVADASGIAAPLPMTLVSATATIANPSVDTHGIIADELMNYVNMTYGPGFIQSELNTLTSAKTPVPVAQSQLDKLNQKFAASLQGYRLMGAVEVPENNQLIILVANPWNPDMEGSMAAKVVWNASELGGPRDCGIYGFSADAQTGPAPILDWHSKQLGQALHLQYTPTNIGAAQSVADGTMFCEADFGAVPYAIPMTVSPATSRSASTSQFAGAGWALTPAKQTAIAAPFTIAKFQLKSTIQPGTGVSEVNTVPTPDAGDPAGSISVLHSLTAAQKARLLGNAANTAVTNTSVFKGAGAAAIVNAQAPAVAAPTVATSKLRLRLLNLGSAAAANQVAEQQVIR